MTANKRDRAFDVAEGCEEAMRERGRFYAGEFSVALYRQKKRKLKFTEYRYIHA